MLTISTIGMNALNLLKNFGTSFTGILLKSVFLVDHSKFGTYVNDARILRDGRRVNLTGQGHFQLTRHANAIRFVYWTDAMPNVASANLRPAVHVEPDLAPVELTT